MATILVKVAVFRNAYDHLYRIANVDYHACVGVLEIESWKVTAARMLAEAKTLECGRATAYDREQFGKAIAAVTQQLIAADARIAQLQSKNVLSPAQRAAAQRMRALRPPVIPGTNGIADERERLRWYNDVVEAMRTHDVVGVPMTDQFCTIAGVPD